MKFIILKENKMKKRLILIIVLALLMISVGSAYAGGGPNGTWVQFSGCDSYWRLTGSGIAHEFDDLFFDRVSCCLWYFKHELVMHLHDHARA